LFKKASHKTKIIESIIVVVLNSPSMAGATLYFRSKK
jgi:hypothetical protein